MGLLHSNDLDGNKNSILLVEKQIRSPLSSDGGEDVENGGVAHRERRDVGGVGLCWVLLVV